jgi:hypothetical protein
MKGFENETIKTLQPKLKKCLYIRQVFLCSTICFQLQILFSAE